GQRQVSTIYNALNQYHVIMEVAPEFWQSPETLKDIFVSTSDAPVGGVQGTNAVAGTFVAKIAGKTAPEPTANANAARNQNTNQLAGGPGGVSTGPAVSPRAEPMVPLSAFSHF